MEQRAKLLQETTAGRDIHLHLTKRWAEMLYSLCRKELRKREKILATSTFVPEPGKFDANKMRVEVMTEMMLQLREQLGPERGSAIGTEEECNPTPD